MSKFLTRLSQVSGALMLVFVPMIASAQIDETVLGNILGNISSVMNMLIGFAVAVAVFIFIWGLVKYVTSGADKTKREEGRNTMIFGVIVVVVMVSILGIIGVLSGVVDTSDSTIEVPQLPTTF